MSSRDELSVFLTTRGDCQRENGFWAEALRSYQKAVEPAPRNLFATELRDSTARVLRYGEDSAAKVQAALQRQEQRLRTDPRVMIPGMPTVPTANPVSVRAGGPGAPAGGPGPSDLGDAMIGSRGPGRTMSSPRAGVSSVPPPPQEVGHPRIRGAGRQVPSSRPVILTCLSQRQGRQTVSASRR